MNYTEFGFCRITAIAPRLALANPQANAETIIFEYEKAVNNHSSIVLTSELSLTGYSCEDLFLKDELLDATEKALVAVAQASRNALLVFGAPLQLVDSRLVNCAVVCAHGKVLGAVPKVANPSYNEFYENRWFSSGRNIDVMHEIGQFEFRVATNQLFEVGDAKVAVELCEDLWTPQPISAQHALAGATVILNLSASPEQVAKQNYREKLVELQSGRCICAYAYASTGLTESSKDVVFGGHMLIAENGQLIANSDRFRFESQSLVGDVDVHKLLHERRLNRSFGDEPREFQYHVSRSNVRPSLPKLTKVPERHPFIPKDETEFEARAAEIVKIQSMGLAQRLQTSGSQRLVIGVSGGIDSTQALVVGMECLQALERPVDNLVAITMPGPGTTTHTLETVQLLCSALGVSVTTIPIQPALDQHLADIEHNGEIDTTYENAQARERTQVLFDKANQVNGIVIGTGDLSELALGWCTFNADHMASYSVNVGVPKTLVQYLVRWYARHRATPDLTSALDRVLATPISPELLPTEDSNLLQLTEELVGPYELHDFFLFHFLRTGAGVKKIYCLARLVFEEQYSDQEIKRWLAEFFRRFCNNQFKRTTLPAGPKVGTVSLSPRGDWRMPDEIDPGAIVEEIEAL